MDNFSIGLIVFCGVTVASVLLVIAYEFSEPESERPTYDILAGRAWNHILAEMLKFKTGSVWMDTENKLFRVFGVELEACLIKVKAYPSGEDFLFTLEQTYNWKCVHEGW